MAPFAGAAMVAVGLVLVTVMVKVAVRVAPSESVTLAVIVCTPCTRRSMWLERAEGTLDAGGPFDGGAEVAVVEVVRGRLEEDIGAG